MLTYADLAPNKKAFVFELDNVLYPEQDYLLQVYYLFANFLEYTETVPPANDLTDFLKKSYINHGPEGIFEKAMEVFGIDAKYKENFDRLHVSAQLPLKLLLFPPILNLLNAIIEDGKSIFILTRGNPLLQLNKLRHIEWEGLDRKLKVYFYDEIKLKTALEPFVYLIKENELIISEILSIGNNDFDKDLASDKKIDYLDISHLL